jgi:predicted RNA-binding protein YlxR (DUF448 family)
VTHRPERTCAGCGRKAPQDSLLRFTAENGALASGRGRGGRSVYTCPRLSCFERAKSRRAFSRVLRRKVTVDPALERLYTDR